MPAVERRRSVEATPRELSVDEIADAVARRTAAALKPKPKPSADPTRVRHLEREMAQTRSGIERLASDRRRRKGERVVDQAIRENRIDLGERDKWVKRYEEDPELVADVLTDLNPRTPRNLAGRLFEDDAAEAATRREDAARLGLRSDEILGRELGSAMPVKQVPLLPDGVDALPPGVTVCKDGDARGYSGGPTCWTHDGTDASMKAALAKAAKDAKADVSGPTIRNAADDEERAYVDDAAGRLGLPKEAIL